MEKILEVKDLKITHKPTGKTIVREINLELHKKEILGIVGESGSGKSITMYSLLGLLPESLSVEGKIILNNQQINYSQETLKKIRGREIGIIFQDPLNALNPILKIEDQLKLLAKSQNIPYHLAKKEIIETLDRIGIHQSERVLKSFPYQLSGGMLQRVVISLVLLLKPKIIIADEPTTSLDVTIQKEIINILKEIRESHSLSIIFITHDLLLAKEICDNLLIMYSGYIVEKGKTPEIFTTPLHPYTKGLINSVPTVNYKPQKLYYIPGRIPHFSELPAHCPFAPRCPIVEEICLSSMPKEETTNSHSVRCFKSLKTSTSLTWEILTKKQKTTTQSKIPQIIKNSYTSFEKH